MSGNKITELSFPHETNQPKSLPSSPSEVSISNGGGSSSGSTSSNGNHITRPLSKLRKLLWLDLSNNRIYHISANYLPRTLVTVDLSRNLLAIFPQQLFEHLYDLRILSLRDNLIKNLHSTKLETLRLIRMHLEKLDLGMNSIEEIHSDWFQNSYSDVHIKALNLEKNYIKTLPENAFKGTAIVHLVLAFNQIQRIHVNAFDGITETLEYLDLERNELQSVPGAIRKLTKLKYLYLTSNNIAHLSNLPDTTTDNLKVLSLSGNNFTSIPVDGLRNFTELSYLNLGYNTIFEIPEYIFVGWGERLQTLLLRNNKITHLHYESFHGLSEIKEISLSFNDISITNPYVFENVSSTLKILELSFAVFPARSIELIDPLDALIPLTQLMWLGLDNNNLKVLSNTSFASMRELSYINLGFNQLISLPRGLFLTDVHRHLVEIDLSYNSLHTISTGDFNNLSDLQIINLQSNKIRVVEKHSFTSMEYLNSIDLSHNHLSNISVEAFAFLPRLRSLNLQHNSLCVFSLTSLHHVSNMSFPLKVNLSHNFIQSFDGNLSSYMYISKLDMSFNNIKDPISFANLGNTLRELSLIGNSIQSLGNHALGDLEFMEVLNLSRNNITSLRRRSFQGLNNLQVRFFLFFCLLFMLTFIDW